MQSCVADLQQIQEHQISHINPDTEMITLSIGGNEYASHVSKYEQNGLLIHAVSDLSPFSHLAFTTVSAIAMPPSRMDAIYYTAQRCTSSGQIWFETTNSQ